MSDHANYSSNVNIIPNGTGGVKVAGIRVSTNEIQTWRSNDDIIFTPSGTGQVAFGSIEFKGTTLSSADSCFTEFLVLSVYS